MVGVVVERRRAAEGIADLGGLPRRLPRENNDAMSGVVRWVDAIFQVLGGLRGRPRRRLG